MNSIRFLQGDSEGVYQRVFCPLAECRQAFDESASKVYYGVSPYLKLRTAFESDWERVELQCKIQDNAGYRSIFQKAATGARNAIAHTINGYFPDTTWNCNRFDSTKALHTANDVFLTRITEIYSELAFIDNPEQLTALREEILKIKSVLENSLKTIYDVYKNYGLNNNADDKAAEGFKATMRIESATLQELIDTDFPKLIGRLNSKLEKELPLEQGEGKNSPPAETDKV